ncbi:MAG: CHASE domain-containing protein, partial [Candidatus Saccharimonadales bacterium]
SSQVTSTLSAINAARLPSDTQEFKLYPANYSSHLALLTYIAPLSAPQSAIGYNLMSDPVRAATLEAAIKSGQLEATPIITLVTDAPGSNNAMLMVMPIYSGTGDLATSNERQAAIDGFDVLAFHPKALVATVMNSGVVNSKLGVEVSNNGTIIYRTKQTYTHLKKSVNLNVSGQVWKIDFSASSTFALSHESSFIQTVVEWSFAPLVILILLAFLPMISAHKARSSKLQENSQNRNNNQQP